MFSIHTKHAKPENTRQKMWRYLPIDRLLQAIEEDAIYFRNISEMSDQLEGLLTEKTKARYWQEQVLFCKGDIAAANWALKQYEDSRKEFYINCWHQNNQESYLMWKAYADTGCVVQSTYERISAAFDKTPALIEGCVIKYIDFEKDTIDIGNVYTQIGYKDLPYQDEREFRLIFWKSSLENQKFLVNDAGIKISVDNKMLIDNIYLNPVQISDYSQLEKLVKKKGLNCEIRNTKVLEKTKN